MKLCFIESLGTDCVDRTPGAGPVVLPSFDRLRIEGPDHGPVSVGRRDLPAAEDGVRRLAVPRKASLRVHGLGGRRLTASLHPRDEPDPLHPAHGLALPAEGELKVPAGDWILAIESRGAAPDLHLLDAAPGATRTVRYRPGTGWSLVLRAVSKQDREPVAGARVVLQPPEPRLPPHLPEGGAEEEPDGRKPPRTAETGAAGLALVPGVEEPVVDAEVRHPDFAGTTVPGLAGAAGSLELREVPLGPGATVEATLRVDGEPAVDWRCALLDRTPPVFGSSREVRSVDAGDDGVCRADKLPEGAFWLRATAPEGDTAAERQVRLYDGETTSVTFDLSPIAVEGEVRVGEESVAGYTVRVFRLREEGATYFAEPVAEATTGEEGAYETTLWDTGPHHFSLVDPGGRSVESERAEVQRPDVRVDFRLASGSVEGLVVDEDGRPVAGATVEVAWTAGGRSQGTQIRAAEDGAFRLPREAEAGVLEVTARHPGFRPDRARLTLAEDASTPPLVLTLERRGLLEGRLVRAGGRPAAGVVVLSFSVSPGGGLERKGWTHTDGEGRFEVQPAERSPTRVFATGPGCPLTVADLTLGGTEPVVLTCSEASGALLLRFRDAEGRPVAGEQVLLRLGDRVIPQEVLAGHLLLLGMSPGSDGAGRLVLPRLPPGAYDVYLAGRASEAHAAQGLPWGHAGSVTLVPAEAVELEIPVVQ